jgi:UDPglucose 6-dehydrogenase
MLPVQKKKTHLIVYSSFNMNIIIAGYGFVGKAVANSIDQKNTLHIVDPKLGEKTVKDYSGADGVIICVGTPSTQLGDCDVGQIYQVMDTVPETMPVLIKCTVRPDYLNRLLVNYPKHSICYSPEFLRATTANEDFANQTYMLLGGEDPNNLWSDLFRQSLKNLNSVVYCTLTEASMVKYATNCFLSVKVTFFNQLYDMCRENGANYDSVINMLKMDNRIGMSHMQVPGPDGSRGFGGACFPKDTNAFIHYADSLQVSHTLVESAVKYNKKVRKNP